MKTMNTLSIRVVIAVTLMLLTGCVGQQHRTQSSVIDYLYPQKENTVVQPSVPLLKLPVKVGIAFVPEKRRQTSGVNIWSSFSAGHSLAETEKANLLEQVAKHFRQYDFVDDIEIIPSPYLTAGGSFQNLEQIRTMYGIDVIALVSYDQMQFTDEGLASLSYWTLIGAYIVSGEKNDTSTMMDTVVYDIQSRSLLFRAPGTSNIKGSATPINLSEELRNDSIAGFREATTRMTENLDQQLARFKEKIKASPEKARIEHRQGYSGGGAFGPVNGLLLCVWLLAGAVKRRQATV
jgi:rhombotail lipoprotein